MGEPSRSSPFMSSPSSTTALYNVEIEASSLAVLLQFPDTFGDFYLIGREDYSKVHQPLWDIISAQLGSTPPGSVTPIILSEKLKGYGITLDGFDAYDYLSGLLVRFVAKTDAPILARELKRLTVRRQLIDKMDAAKRELVAQPNATFEEMTGVVEKGLSSITTAYHKSESTEVMGNLVRVVEERAANPLSFDQMGFLGPFQSINETIGSLCYRGSYTVIGARSAVGKSSFGWFYQTYLLEKYPNTHLLHLDSAEMTFEELCWRAVCCLSGGRIPYHAVFRGEWKKNKEWSDLIRGEIWPRVKKMEGRMSFKNIGSMSPKERIAFIRRYYYNKVGRGNHCLIFDDYLKGVESMSKATNEYQAMGYYVGDQKTLVTDELESASVWTAVQDNRGGIITGKRAEDIQDSEGNFSLSDRIFQQSTHSFGMRFKVPEELAKEHKLFGNLRLTPFKKRQLLGEKYKEVLMPVKLPNGKFGANYFNLLTTDFFYEDRGSLLNMLPVLGAGVVDVAQVTADGQPVNPVAKDAF